MMLQTIGRHCSPWQTFGSPLTCPPHLQRPKHRIQLQHVPQPSLSLPKAQVLRHHSCQRHAGVALQAAGAQPPAGYLLGELAVAELGTRLNVEAAEPEQMVDGAKALAG